MARPTNSEKKRQSIRRPLRSCIVAGDLFGESDVAENSAAIAGIAQKFAAIGGSVTLLWAPAPEGNDQIEEKEVERLRQSLLERFLINLVLLPPSEALLPGQGSPPKRSIAVYHYIKEQQFDAVYFVLEGGLAYYSLLAKETGVYEAPPRMHVIVQSPIAWASEADKFFLENTAQVTTAYMEKYCVEACDSLICTSQTVLTWMRNKGWKIPAETTIVPPPIPQEWRLSGKVTSTNPPLQGITELVFLTGPEYHKGITLLCDALDTVAHNLPTNLTITMMGRFGQVLGEHTGGMLLRRARDWPFKLKLLPRVSPRECFSYLSDRGALAVFPAYDSSTNLWVSACIMQTLPFIATNAGSIPELLTAESRSRCLCDPTVTSLAQKIVDTVNKGCPKAAPSKCLEENDDIWTKHLDAVAAAGEKAQKKTRKPDKLPLVSIVLVHHDRPQYLLQSVTSVEHQDYENLELILVDDGSKRPESRSVLDALEPGFKKRGWKILREENKYLGAARNTGVRAARGAHILFLDDDNALFASAVSTLVRAMDSSGADICTCFRKTFYDESVPDNERAGYIQYFVLGGSLDVGLIENSFGDATALIRREVFDKIGYQVELFGRTGEDWEFFARATLAGLKLRVVPEPLYWYRSSTRGMLRNSHWYDNRLPTLKTFRKHGFKGLEYAYHLALSAHVNRSEIEGFRDNLRFSPWDSRFLRLCDLKPNSDEALDLLAAIAASEGQPEAASALLAQIQRKDHATALMETGSESKKAPIELSSTAPFVTTTRFHVRECPRDEIVRARLGTDYPSELPLMLFPREGGLFLRPSEMGPVVAMLVDSFPSFARRAIGYVEIAHKEASPFEFAMALTRSDRPADWRLETPANCIEFSGWKRVEEKFQLHEIALEMKQLAIIPFVLNLAIRLPKGSSASPANAFWRKLMFTWDE